MKKQLRSKGSIIFVVIVAISLVSCKKDGIAAPNNNDPEVVDGYYVAGSGVAFSKLDEHGQMKTTMEANTQTKSSSLLEIYLPVAEDGEFNIIKVGDYENTVFGPASDFALVELSERGKEEPNIEVKAYLARGGLAKTNTTFRVFDPGMYHIVYDTELNTVAIARVNWAIIGSAVGGWDKDVALTEGVFSKTEMTFSNHAVVLLEGEYKYRYSEGWKIRLSDDPVVSVNASLGGWGTDLTPGGNAVINSNPGTYTVTMSWNSESGFSVDVQRTGDAPSTDWSAITFDMVGNGIRSTTPGAVTDPVWSWGYRVVADNNGLPFANGDEYTYTWTGIELSADGQFKLRAVDLSRVGFEQYVQEVNATVLDPGSTDATNNVVDENKFQVASPGVYNISLSIDENDKMFATVVRTGDLSTNTDWSGSTFDIVGNNIDAANVDAVAESYWGWTGAYQIWADNSGLPAVAGEVYTYVWTDITLNNEGGFKLRKIENGAASYEVNATKLNADDSNSNIYCNEGDENKFATNATGVYTITMAIDAANNDSISVIITGGAQ